jgi:hypothetical protein
MKKLYFFAVLFICSLFTSNAQFVDDMVETCTVTPLPPWWSSWSGTSADFLVCSTGGHNGPYSGYIDGGGVIDAILILGNRSFGEWYLEFWAYVPSNQSGYFNVQAAYPVIPSWCGEIYLNKDNTNPGGGEVLGFNPFTFTFPHDQWFLVEWYWDITLGLSNATWELKVDGVQVVPSGTPYVDSAGAAPAGLGGINFYSAHSSNELYLDDFAYDDEPLPLSIKDFDQTSRFIAHPNPASDMLTLEAEEVITSVAIYNILGQKIFSSEINALTTQIDISKFDVGIYFVKAVIGSSEGAMKIIVD